jgi:hypothetical protein
MSAHFPWTSLALHFPAGQSHHIPAPQDRRKPPPHGRPTSTAEAPINGTDNPRATIIATISPHRIRICSIPAFADASGFVDLADYQQYSDARRGRRPAADGFARG